MTVWPGSERNRATLVFAGSPQSDSLCLAGHSVRYNFLPLYICRPTVSKHPATGGAHRPVIGVRATALGEGTQHLHFEATREALELDASFDPQVIVEGTAQRVGRHITLELRVRGGWHSECDRCLAPVHQEVDEPLVLYYTEEPGAARSPQEDDLESEEVRMIDADQESIVLDEDVRQTMLLSVPFKILCREECKGLCSTCGTDLNNGPCNCTPEIDPRWAKLAALLKPEADPDAQTTTD